MHKHHEDLMSSLQKEVQEIFDKSDQAIYLYLDDEHKACNQKFADLLGYDSPRAWAKITKPFADTFVAKTSQMDLVSAYQAAMEKMVASALPVTWRTKDNQEIDSTVIIIPTIYQGHKFALHFISRGKQLNDSSRQKYGG